MVAKNATEGKEMDKKKQIDSTETEPKVFGWVAGRPVIRQIHPETNPYNPEKTEK
jgi:hypothetical protein